MNEELEVGYDQHFERRWWLAEQTGRCVMVLFVAAGLAGFFGRGPFSHQSVASVGTGITVDFEPVARAQAPTQVTLHLDNLTAAPTVEILLGTNIVEPMGLQRVEPQPSLTRLVKDGMVLTIPIPPGTRDAKLRLVLQPVSLGPNELIAKLNDDAPQRWTQFILP